MSVRRDLPDPKSIVKSVPLPYSTHKDVKIQARTLEVYNAYLPLRDNVRKENYARRQDQQINMGFQTPKNVPYRIVGEPLYLEQADIILNGLGQFKRSIKETMRQVETPVLKPKESKDMAKPIAGFSFRSLKESKQLINLNYEVKKNENILKRVRLGASLFQILRVDEEKKKKLANNKREIQESQMRIRPMIDSDDEEAMNSEEETMNEFKNFNYQDPNNSITDDTPDELRTNRTVRIEEGLDKDNVSSARTIEARPQTHPAHGNKFNPNLAGRNLKRPKTSATKIIRERSKPYAPIYSSLIAPDEISETDKISIKRQLCVLLWILESMSAEPPNYIGPLRTCFLINDLGGERITEKNALKSKEKEDQWIRFKKSNERQKNEK